MTHLPGSMIYTTPTVDLFRCKTKSGLLIEFVNGEYEVAMNDPDKAEKVEVLTFHVSRGRLKERRIPL